MQAKLDLRAIYRDAYNFHTQRAACTDRSSAFWAEADRTAQDICEKYAQADFVTSLMSDILISLEGEV